MDTSFTKKHRVCSSSFGLYYPVYSYGLLLFWSYFSVKKCPKYTRTPFRDTINTYLGIYLKEVAYYLPEEYEN